MRPKPVTVTTWLMALFNILGYALLWGKPSTAIIGYAAMYTIFIGLGYVVLWFYWRGANWARVLVLLTSIVAIYNLRTLPSANAAVKLMLIGEAVISVFLLYWLNTAQAKLFFKHPARRS
jgi:hypothetical protein